MNKPEVVHKLAITPQPGDVYVGRPSQWGNPYIIGRDGSREDVIEMYASAIQVHLIDELRALKPVRLVCWCAPLPCHADFLAFAISTQRKAIDLVHGKE